MENYQKLIAIDEAVRNNLISDQQKKDFWLKQVDVIKDYLRPEVTKALEIVKEYSWAAINTDHSQREKRLFDAFYDIYEGLADAKRAMIDVESSDSNLHYHIEASYHAVKLIAEVDLKYTTILYNVAQFKASVAKHEYYTHHVSSYFVTQSVGEVKYHKTIAELIGLFENTFPNINLKDVFTT